MVTANESVDDAVELAEGGAYLASLGVYHELHCLVIQVAPLNFFRQTTDGNYRDD